MEPFLETYVATCDVHRPHLIDKTFASINLAHHTFWGEQTISLLNAIEGNPRLLKRALNKEEAELQADFRSAKSIYAHRHDEQVRESERNAKNAAVRGKNNQPAKELVREMHASWVLNPTRYDHNVKVFCYEASMAIRTALHQTIASATVGQWLKEGKLRRPKMR